MTLFSFLINTLIFFLLVNLPYINRKRRAPYTPDKSMAQFLFFPLALGLVFTLLFDVLKGILIYQLMIFILTALLLYWLFYRWGAKKW